MITKRELRKMLGVAKVNETTGYLFEEPGPVFGFPTKIKFAYRTYDGIAVDGINVGSSVSMRVNENMLSGYNLSGKNSSGQYADLDSEIPSLPILEDFSSESDLDPFNNRVVVYGSKLAVVKNRELFFRTESETMKLNMKTGEMSAGPTRKSIYLVSTLGMGRTFAGFWLYPEDGMHPNYDRTLRRNGL